MKNVHIEAASPVPLSRKKPRPSPEGGARKPDPTSSHRDKASRRKWGSGRASEARGRSCESREDDADTDARKAEGATKTVLQIPRPPHLTEERVGIGRRNQEPL